MLHKWPSEALASCTINLTASNLVTIRQDNEDTQFRLCLGTITHCYAEKLDTL